MLSGGVMGIRVNQRVLCFVLLFFCFVGKSYSAIIIIPNITVSPNNDDYTGLDNPNYKWYGIEYADFGIHGWDAAGWSGSGYNIQESGGVTEYLFSQDITNNSGLDWAGYTLRLSLGWDTESSIVFSTLADGYNFDTDTGISEPNPTYPEFLTLLHEHDSLTYTGLIPNNSTINITYSIDVPDGLSVDMIWVMEKPLAPVPIPPALYLFGTGLLGLIGMARKKS